ncbi:MAG: tyrosine-protein phosphatase [Clostridia bacterium]|nr:tyrosine-protein phosphatase [Clostridia bacterium]
MRKILALVMTLALLVFAAAALAEDAPITVTEIQKYGNLVLSVSGSDLLAQGYTWGDIVDVTINGQTFEMPVGSNYSDVDQGSMICRVVIKEDLGEDYVILAINMGDLATTAGIATKEKTEADPGYVWHYNEGVEEPATVAFAMKEQAGYYDQWVIHQLVRSENREDYPELSDAEYANFRAVKAGKVGEGKLYRSSSPVNPEINRNKEADAAASEAGVKTFVNLADNEETMKGYEGFAESYYSAQNIIALNLGVDFAADEFKAGLAEGFRFIATHEGPYLVHCTEGKDRAGFTAAVLESLMGASAEEIVADYMVTYFNYYGVQPGTEQYDVIANSNIRKSLAAAFGLETIDGADLEAAAGAYLLSIGMTQEEIDAVKANLGE